MCGVILSAALSRFHRIVVDQIAFFMCAHLKFYRFVWTLSFHFLFSLHLWLLHHDYNHNTSTVWRSYAHFKIEIEEKTAQPTKTSTNTRHKINYVHLFSRRKVINHFIIILSSFYVWNFIFRRSTEWMWESQSIDYNHCNTDDA